MGHALENEFNVYEKLAEFVRAAPENASRSISIAFKRLSQSFDFKAGAKQREQAAHQYHSAPGRQEDVGFPAELRKMPEFR
jgi:hypothetical protein